MQSSSIFSKLPDGEKRDRSPQKKGGWGTAARSKIWQTLTFPPSRTSSSNIAGCDRFVFQSRLSPLALPLLSGGGGAAKSDLNSASEVVKNECTHCKCDEATPKRRSSCRFIHMNGGEEKERRPLKLKAIAECRSDGSPGTAG